MVKQWSLKACRIDKELTLSNVANLVDVTTKTISNWERGKTPIPAIKLEELCKIYEVDRDNVRIPIIKDGLFDV